MGIDLDGRVAVVTGASRGLGQAIAVALAGAGASVCVTARSEGNLEETREKIGVLGKSCTTAKQDVLDLASIDPVLDGFRDRHGKIDILVNNAGILRDNLLFKMTDDDWDQVMQVHLRGAFLMTRAVQAHQVAAKWGRIVNLSSTSALGNRGQANYAAAKAGLQGFTKTLAIELGRYGVTANAIAPGFIQTDMTRATAERVGVPFDDFVAAAVQQIPVQRAGVPDDIAAAASYFCSEVAGFCSGQVLYVAGGPTS